jgi:hypothetical protein
MDLEASHQRYPRVCLALTPAICLLMLLPPEKRLSRPGRPGDRCCSDVAYEQRVRLAQEPSISNAVATDERAGPVAPPPFASKLVWFMSDIAAADVAPRERATRLGNRGLRPAGSLCGAGVRRGPGSLHP